MSTFSFGWSVSLVWCVLGAAAFADTHHKPSPHSLCKCAYCFVWQGGERRRLTIWHIAPTATYEIGTLVFKMMWHFSEFGKFILLLLQKLLQADFSRILQRIRRNPCWGFRPNHRKRFLNYPDRGLFSNPGRAFWRDQGIGFIQNLEVNSLRYLKRLSLKYWRGFPQNPGRKLFQNLGENSSARNIAEDSFKHNTILYSIYQRSHFIIKNSVQICPSNYSHRLLIFCRLTLRKIPSLTKAADTCDLVFPLNNPTENYKSQMPPCHTHTNLIVSNLKHVR